MEKIQHWWKFEHCGSSQSTKLTLENNSKSTPSHFQSSHRPSPDLSEKIPSRMATPNGKQPGKTTTSPLLSFYSGKNHDSNNGFGKNHHEDFHDDKKYEKNHSRSLSRGHSDYDHSNVMNLLDVEEEDHDSFYDNNNNTEYFRQYVADKDFNREDDHYVEDSDSVQQQFSENSMGKFCSTQNNFTNRSHESPSSRNHYSKNRTVSFAGEDNEFEENFSDDISKKNKQNLAKANAKTNEKKISGGMSHRQIDCNGTSVMLPVRSVRTDDEMISERMKQADRTRNILKHKPIVKSPGKENSDKNEGSKFTTTNLSKAPLPRKSGPVEVPASLKVGNDKASNFVDDLPQRTSQEEDVTHLDFRNRNVIDQSKDCVATNTAGNNSITIPTNLSRNNFAPSINNSRGLPTNTRPRLYTAFFMGPNARENLFDDFVNVLSEQNEKKRNEDRLRKERIEKERKAGFYGPGSTNEPNLSVQHFSNKMSLSELNAKARLNSDCSSKNPIDSFSSPNKLKKTVENPVAFQDCRTPKDFLKECGTSTKMWQAGLLPPTEKSPYLQKSLENKSSITNTKGSFDSAARELFKNTSDDPISPAFKDKSVNNIIICEGTSTAQKRATSDGRELKKPVEKPIVNKKSLIKEATTDKKIPVLSSLNFAVTKKTDKPSQKSGIQNATATNASIVTHNNSTTTPTNKTPLPAQNRLETTRHAEILVPQNMPSSSLSGSIVAARHAKSSKNAPMSKRLQAALDKPLASEKRKKEAEEKQAEDEKSRDFETQFEKAYKDPKYANDPEFPFMMDQGVK